MVGPLTRCVAVGESWLEHCVPSPSVNGVVLELRDFQDTRETLHVGPRGLKISAGSVDFEPVLPANVSSTELEPAGGDRRRPVPGQWLLLRFVAGQPPTPMSAWASIVAMDDEAFDAATDNAELLALAPGSAVATEFTDGTRMQLIEGSVIGVADDVVRVRANWPQNRRTRPRKNVSTELQAIRVGEDPTRVEIGTVIDVSPIAIRASVPVAVVCGEHLMLSFSLPTGDVRTVATVDDDAKWVDDTYQVRLNFINADDASMAAVAAFLQS